MKAERLHLNDPLGHTEALGRQGGQEPALNPRVMPLHWLDRGFWLLTVLFFALTLPIALTNHPMDVGLDEGQYHLPGILKVRAKWPLLDVREDSLAATPPFYHYLLATGSLLVGDDVRALRLLNCCISFLIPATLYFWVRKTHGTGWACLVVLPLAVSSFVVKSAAWLATDNAALLLVIWSLMAMLATNRGNGIRIGLLAGLATMVRQLHAWLMAPALVRAVLPKNRSEQEADLPRLQRVVSLGAALIPGFVLAYLYFQWDGLVPEGWRSASTGLSLCPLAYLFSVFGLLGVFYVALLPRHHWHDWLTSRAVHGMLLLGLVCAVAGPTKLDYEAGRWGGYLWNLSERVPAIGDRSLLFVILAPVGAALVAVSWLEVRRAGRANEADLWLTAVAAWSAAFLVNRQVFHRYFEPMILVFAILAVTLATRGRPQPKERVVQLSLWTLTLGQLVVTLLTTHYRAFATS